MRRLVVATGLIAITSVTYVSSFGNAFFAKGNHHRNDASVMARTTSMCPQLYAQESSTSQSAQPTSDSSPNARPRTKKKNKYADFSKADNLSMDPLDAMIFESRTKLREMYSDDSKSLKRRRKLSSSELSSLESVDRLLTDYRDVGGAAEVEETRERNKRSFPDTTTIDPYDPTTYGYIELGKCQCLCIICLFRQSPSIHLITIERILPRIERNNRRSPRSPRPYEAHLNHRLLPPQTL